MSRALLPHLVANFRDLGGLRTAAGHAVRSRRLLRSAALTHLAPAGVATLTELLGPGVYADLRTDGEVDRDGAPDALVAAGWRWLRIPVRDKPSGRDLEPLTRYRAAMPRYLAAADEVAAAVVGDHRPIVLGCSLGKDRTGLVAALLLAGLGVAAADIGADFELSNPSLAAQRHLLPTRWRDPGARIEVVSADACLAALAGLGTAAVRGAERLRAELVITDGAVRPQEADRDGRTMTGDVYDQVLEIVRRVLQCGPFEPKVDFFDLDASSLQILQIVELVNDECEVPVSVTDTFDAPDVDSFARLVADRRRAQANATRAD